MKHSLRPIFVVCVALANVNELGKRPWTVTISPMQALRPKLLPLVILLTAVFLRLVGLTSFSP
ncbi:MAG: hypothetical protein KDD89_11395, partial [Anaerolineales bacterium]|nr:hypothetical protein [Anaerolineales bacterium]